MKFTKIFLISLFSLFLFFGFSSFVNAESVTGSVTVTVLPPTIPDPVAKPLLTVINNRPTATVLSIPGGIACGTGNANCTEEYVKDTKVIVSAPAQTGFTITISGGCTVPTTAAGAAASCSVTMSSDKTVTVTYTAVGVKYDLTVTKAGTGNGTVTGISNPTQTNINCGISCNAETKSYSNNSTITLTATPNNANSSSFTGWEGACINKTGNCVVSMSEAKNVIARFSLPGGFPATVISPTSSVATCSSVTLTANVTSLGNPPYTSRGFCYRGYGAASRTDGLSTCVTAPGTTLGSYSLNITGLSPSTSYSFIGYADNAFAPGVTSQGTFSTLAITSPGCTLGNVPPTVIKPTASTSTTTAILGATISSFGLPASISSHGIMYGTSPVVLNNTIPATSTAVVNSPYTVNVSGLSACTVYYYKGYAVNQAGTGYTGAPQSFTTLGCSPANVSLVATPGVCDSGKIDVSWAPANGATGYQLADGTTGIYDGAGTTYKHTVPNNGATHNYKVRSKYGSYLSPYTSVVSVSAPSACTVPLPNLTASGVGPSSALSGIPETFSATIKNEGTLGTGKSFSNVFLIATSVSNQSNPTPHVVATATLGASPASRVITKDITFGTAGTYYVNMCADQTTISNSSGSINESSDLDNCTGWKTVNVGNAASLKPDLISEINSNSIPVTVGKAVSVNGKIINNSNVDIKTSKIDYQYYARKKGETTTGDPVSTHKTFYFSSGSLDALASFSAGLFYAFPSVGKWQIDVCADEDLYVDESNENNNCSDWYDVEVFPAIPSGGDSTADLVVNGVIDDNNVPPVKYNSKVNLVWTSSGSHSNCTLAGGEFGSGNTVSSNGNNTSSPLKTTATYTLTCGTGPDSVDTVKVTVLPPDPNFDEN